MLKEYMLICRNAEGVHGKRKVGNPCSRMSGAKCLSKRAEKISNKILPSLEILPP